MQIETFDDRTSPWGRVATAALMVTVTSRTTRGGLIRRRHGRLATARIGITSTGLHPPFGPEFHGRGFWMRRRR